MVYHTLARGAAARVQRPGGAGEVHKDSTKRYPNAILCVQSTPTAGPLVDGAGRAAADAGAVLLVFGSTWHQQPPPPVSGCRRTIFFSFVAESSGGVYSV